MKRAAFLRGLGLGALLCCPIMLAQAIALPLTDWRHENPEVAAPWRSVQLDKRIKPTTYRVVLWDGVNAMEAQADNSMALLGRSVDVDLFLTPVLCWRWRVEGVVKSANMSKKSGDDYAARIYLALRLPSELLSFTTRAKLGIARRLYGDDVPDGAINYVWDNLHSVGTRQPNTYTAQNKMIVLQSGETKLKRWITERVNVLDDMRLEFGTDQAKLTFIAIAADTDNTGEKVRSGFADLHFVGKDDRCNFPEVVGNPP